MHGVHTMHCKLIEDILNLQMFLVTCLLYVSLLSDRSTWPHSSLQDLTVLAVKTIDVEI